MRYLTAFLFATGMMLFASNSQAISLHTITFDEAFISGPFIDEDYDHLGVVFSGLAIASISSCASGACGVVQEPGIYQNPVEISFEDDKAWVGQALQQRRDGESEEEGAGCERGPGSPPA